jgi:hypothetical protein
MTLPRVADLDGTPIRLLGHVPRQGHRVTADFRIPAARGADLPLTSATLARGIVILSTLPNIRRHACLSQIVALDEHTPHVVPRARIFHVAADEAEHWQEVDRYHPSVRAPGYSLAAADLDSRIAFSLAFGVAVEGHRRIAHGCFALRDGIVLNAEVPYHQMHPVEALPFLERLRSLVAG